MDALSSTSFDRYARYVYTHRVRTELLGPAPVRILDVGDPYGTIGALFPGDDTTSLDVFAEGASPISHQHVIGSGFELPFPAATFDLVAAHDVLEHVPGHRRSSFVEELLRVSAGPVVVAAPFADDRTDACERIVNAYYVAHLGRSLEPLDEHAEHGLPDLSLLVDFLEGEGIDHLVYSDGWLYHWLGLMLLKAHYVSLGAAALDRASDSAFNQLLRDRDVRPPHYRRALILRPPAGTVEVLGAPSEPSQADAADERAELEALGWEMVQALPHGDDPSAPSSTFRSWLEDARSRSGNVGYLADSMTTVLDEARRTLDDESTVLPVSPSPRPPSITALVFSRSESRTDRAVGLLRSVEQVGDVVVCDPIAGGDALAVATAVPDLKTSAILLVDPDIELTAEQVRTVIAAYAPDRPCVGFHRAAPLAPDVAADIRPDGDDALYVARELMLVARDLYRGLGGLDGRFRGQLDEVDFGWRVNLLGHKVTTVGPATWPARPSENLSEDVAVLWCWLKNLEISTAETLLPRELLALLGKESGALSPVPWFDGLDSLVDARAEVARLRTIPDVALLDRFGNLRIRPAASLAASGAQSLLDDLFPLAITRSTGDTVVVLGASPHRRRMTALARLAAPEARVTLAVDDAGSNNETYESVVINDEYGVAKLIEHADVVVVAAAQATRHREILRRWDGVLVIDLAEAPPAFDDDALLQRADVLLCDSRHQREHWSSHPALERRRVEASEESLVRVVVTPTVTASWRPWPDPGPMPVVVLDVIDHPDPLGSSGPIVEQLTKGDDFPDVTVAITVHDEPARTVVAAALGRVLPRQLEVVVGEDARERLLSSAHIVVRPTPDERRLRLATAAYGADALALGVPIITTTADPVSPLVVATGAGSVMAEDSPRIVAEIRRALTETHVGSTWRLAAASSAAAFSKGTSARPFLEVVRQPWKWRYAHTGHRVPLASLPQVAALLDHREAEAVRSVTASLQAELDEGIRDAVATATAVADRLRVRLEAVENELADARAEVGRVKGHPAVRLLLAVRRRLRNA